MRLLDELVEQAKSDTKKRTRADWTEEDYRIALDLKLTGAEAGELLGCSSRTVYHERREWDFEWRS